MYILKKKLGDKIKSTVCRTPDAHAFEKFVQNGRWKTETNRPRYAENTARKRIYNVSSRPDHYIESEGMYEVKIEP